MTAAYVGYKVAGVAGAARRLPGFKVVEQLIRWTIV